MAEEAVEAEEEAEPKQEAESKTGWWAKGLLFENCNCQVVCPGHVHFSNECTHERCIGYWAIRFDEGSYGDVALDGVRAVIAYDCPSHMISGDWTEVVIIDERCSDAQWSATEAILTGRAGGPWEVLDRFVGRRLPTRALPIEIADEGAVKKIVVEGLLEGTIEEIRGKDRDQPVTFQNMFNQIHAPEQIIARGNTAYDDGDIAVTTEGTHALYSNFDWSVSPE